MATRQLLPAPFTPSSPITEYSENAHVPMTKRSNVSNACQACRQKKLRCGGQRPCAHCLSNRKECVFSRPDGRRQSERKESLKAMQSEIDKLQATLDMLTSGSDDQALHLLRELRSGISEDVKLPRAKATPTEGDSHHPRLPRSKIGGKQLDCNARHNGGTHCNNVPIIFTQAQLPPRTVVDEGATFFFGVISGLSYVMERSYFDELCERVYAPKSQPTNFDMAEICAVAAVGSHYHPQGVLDDVKEALFRTALQYTNDLIENNTLRALRCIACLCMYGIIEKRRSTRALIHLGLQIARWASGQYGEADEEYTQWKKLFRTTAFLECWLSTTLGYDPDLTPDEAQVILTSTSPKPRLDDVNEISQVKISELGLLKVKVLKRVCLNYLPDSATIEELMVEMEAWHRSLPLPMTLPRLMMGKAYPLTAAQQGAPFLAHAKYLGTVILLHRRILGASADAMIGAGWQAINITEEEAQIYHNRCVEAARTSARIFMLLGFTSESSKLHLRCWLSIFEIFTACTVLLYDAAVKFSMGMQHDQILFEDLERTKACLAMLCKSAGEDFVAEHLYETLLRVHQELECLRQKPTFKSDDNSSEEDRSSESLNTTHSPMQGSPMDARTHMVTTKTIEIMARILKDPFGHGEKTGFDLTMKEAIACTPDWWSDTNGDGST